MNFQSGPSHGPLRVGVLASPGVDGPSCLVAPRHGPGFRPSGICTWPSASNGRNGSGTGSPKFPDGGRTAAASGPRSTRILLVSPGVLGVPGQCEGTRMRRVDGHWQCHPAVAMGQLPWADTSTDTVELRVCHASSTGSTCRRSLPQSAPARALHLQPRAFRRSERAWSSAAAQLTDRHRSPPPRSVGAPK